MPLPVSENKRGSKIKARNQTTQIRLYNGHKMASVCMQHLTNTCGFSLAVAVCTKANHVLN